MTLRRALILLIILGLSVGFGFAFDGIAGAVEKSTHPRPEALSASVGTVSEQNALPEAVLWAMIKCESDFQSNAKNGDRVGLLQLTPETFSMIQSEILATDALDAGLLYDPETNLRAGAAYLSHLYRRFGVWETVFAAWRAGESTVEAWLRDPQYTADGGRLQSIPDDEVRTFTEDVSRAFEMYTKLYY